jgi:hypothetical protein
MTDDEAGNGDGGKGQGEAGGGEAAKPERALAPFWRSPEGALFISTTLTALSFLGHSVFLLLVEPLRYLEISGASALAYATIPSFIGVVSLLFAVYNLGRIKQPSDFHNVLLICAIVFGGLCTFELVRSALQYLSLAIQHMINV